MGPQNIDSAAITAFATGESHQPIAGVNLLPLYTDVVPGTPVVLASTNAAGTYNKIGNRRFLRFVSQAGTHTYRFTVTTSNPDPQRDVDFIIYRTGLTIVSAESPPSQSGETADVQINGAATYIIDAYDCANGCSTPQGTPGAYNLTVTVTQLN